METHTEKKEKEKNILPGLLAFMARDFLYIMVCLIALGGCAYTLYTVGEYQDTCNDHWQTQMKVLCPTITEYDIFNSSFNFMGGYDEDKNKNQNT